MAETLTAHDTTDHCLDMASELRRLQIAATTEPAPSLELRIDRLKRALSIIIENRGDLITAANADFGQRSAAHTMLGDLGSSERSLEAAIAGVEGWMKSGPRDAGALGQAGAQGQTTQDREPYPPFAGRCGRSKSLSV